METSTRLKKIAVLLGDAVILYLSLFLTLFLRYGALDKQTLFDHLESFSLIFLIWLIVFYILELYDVNSFKNAFDFYKRIAGAFFTGGIIAIAIFYLIPAFGIAPKTNLFILLIIASSLLYLWRSIFNSLLANGTPSTNILLIGYSNLMQELADFLARNPQLGYNLKFWMKEGLQDAEFKHLSQILLANNIQLIVVPAHIKKQGRASKLIYKNFILGIEIKDLATVYESVFGKIPIAELEEVWFLENLKTRHKFYDLFKRIADFIVAILAFVIFSPFILIIGLAILVLNGWPIIYHQNRIGEKEKHFELYKFRTMRLDAEKMGPQWSPENDKRVTLLGKFLRRTHLDELPQLINVIRGDLAIVGPRPERPEFVEQLKKDIPYFEIRHLVRPGITGWAQVKYKYGASIEESYEKLQYDLYYLKNRSFILDILIILRTVKKFFA